MASRFKILLAGSVKAANRAHAQLTSELPEYEFGLCSAKLIADRDCRADAAIVLLDRSDPLARWRQFSVVWEALQVPTIVFAAPTERVEKLIELETAAKDAIVDPTLRIVAAGEVRFEPAFTTEAIRVFLRQKLTTKLIPRHAKCLHEWLRVHLGLSPEAAPVPYAVDVAQCPWDYCRRTFLDHLGIGIENSIVEGLRASHSDEETGTGNRTVTVHGS